MDNNQKMQALEESLDSLKRGTDNPSQEVRGERSFAGSEEEIKTNNLQNKPAQKVEATSGNKVFMIGLVFLLLSLVAFGVKLLGSLF